MFLRLNGQKATRRRWLTGFSCLFPVSYLFFVGVASGLDVSFDFFELSEGLGFEKITTDAVTGDRVRDIWFSKKFEEDPYFYDKYPNGIDKNWMLSNISLEGYAYKSVALEEYLFFNILSGGSLQNLLAVYEPDINRPDSGKHILLDTLAIDTNRELPAQNIFIAGIESLFVSNGGYKRAGAIKDTAVFSVYTFYWHYLYMKGGYEFGNPADEIYCFNDVHVFSRKPVYRYLAKVNSPLRGDATYAITRVLPIGEVNEEHPNNPYITFYSWDLKTRVLRFWFFQKNIDGELTIKDIVLGYY